MYVCMCCIGDLIWFGNSTSKYNISGRRQVDQGYHPYLNWLADGQFEHLTRGGRDAA